MITITIRNGNETLTTLHRTDDLETAVKRAICRRWGKRAFFWRDNGISVGRTALDGRQYGQVCEPIRGNPGANNCITERVSIEATR